MKTLVNTVRQQALPAEICAVIANNAAPALEWAQQEGIATHTVPHREFPSREAFDAALGDVIERYDPHYVLLAGFMRVLTTDFVKRFNGRLINIHPSLLPAFPGLHTHQQALAAGVQWHGCTVHFVTPLLDHGPIVAQGIVPVFATDTPDALADRLLPLEHRVYAQVVRWLAEGRVSLDETQRVQVEGVISRSFIASGVDAGGGV